MQCTSFCTSCSSFVIVDVVTTASFVLWICRSTWRASRETTSTAWTASVARVFLASTRPSTSSSWRWSTASTTKCCTWCATPSSLDSPSSRTSRRKATQRWLCTLSRTRRRDLDWLWNVATLRWIVYWIYRLGSLIDWLINWFWLILILSELAPVGVALTPVDSIQLLIISWSFALL